MFVCVARISLQIHESGSLKAKRQILRRVTDRVKARFNVSVAEVEDQDLWQKATIGLSVVGNDRRHVNEQMEKILSFIDDMYVAPVISRELEILAFGDRLFQHEVGRDRSRTIGAGGEDGDYEANGVGGEAEEEDEGGAVPPEMNLTIPRGDRSLAEAEGMGEWDRRHDKGGRQTTGAVPAGIKGSKLSLDEARAKARSLRNPREWEKK